MGSVLLVYELVMRETYWNCPWMDEWKYLNAA